ncbi:MAG TPA: ABC transporter ATP-binding protein [Paraburkholderia sp.]|jgi:putative spermidine/putrescine transport system ATP-binding protein|nr:ABC transporter ATP-binding protein [Paraburkholderia sp.]
MNQYESVDVRFERIEHRFGDTSVIKDLDLKIDGGELVALLGPSGCGKSTLLRILAGLQVQSAGRVLIGGDCVDGLAPRQRGVGIVFQNYALFPHMSVAANVAYGLEANGATRRDALREAGAMLEMVRMDAFAARYPRELSGGQQQRVALARTLAVKPRILLLDEPFAALDKSLRLDMQIEIRRLQRELHITTIMVTHDQEEAMSMADRVAVLNRGCLEQFAPATDIYDRPATPFVAGFVGTANLIAAQLSQQGDVMHAKVGDGVLVLERPDCDGMSGARSEPALLAVRPEQWDWFPEADARPSSAFATIQLVLPLGAMLMVEAVLDGGIAVKLTMPRSGPVALSPGTRVALRIKPHASVRVFGSALPDTALAAH